MFPKYSWYGDVVFHHVFFLSCYFVMEYALQKNSNIPYYLIFYLKPKKMATKYLMNPAIINLYTIVPRGHSFCCQQTAGYLRNVNNFINALIMQYYQYIMHIKYSIHRSINVYTLVIMETRMP